MCDNASIPKLGICKVKIKHECVEVPCSCFAVSENGPELLAMPDCEKFRVPEYELHKNRCNLEESTDH